MADPLAERAQSFQVPERLTEEPPGDRWCDVVMKGGVASGVVYPWAILELARKYRFRNIGGTSVGAMAASIAAACEYGRRNGSKYSFEVLRLLPEKLAERVDEKDDGTPITRMRSLFQPCTNGQRLFDAITNVFDQFYEREATNRQAPMTAPDQRRKKSIVRRIFGKLLRFFRIGEPAILITFICAVSVRELTRAYLPNLWVIVASLFTVAYLVFPSLWLLLVGGILLIVVLKGLVDLIRDVIFGVVRNELGFCVGRSQGKNADGSPKSALIEWLNDAVQKAAGLEVDGPPLTFEDLWLAPLWPGGAAPLTDQWGSPRERSINLEMITTNVTHGRPYRLPSDDPDARLFFDPNQWRAFFPANVMDALISASKPYAPMSEADPKVPPGASKFLELPSAKLPIVVAARLSLSYPILFSSIPIYAIDFEQIDPNKRELRLCRFSDGGLCSNFPIHFFDSALPRWPTFGLSLEGRHSYRSKEDVFLPDTEDEARHDSWQRFEPVDAKRYSERSTLWTLFGFLRAAFNSASGWRDATIKKMPHVRRRVARIRLHSDQGQLNIGMPRETILDMAWRYGTESGVQLCNAYAPTDQGAAQAWREHLWVRLQVLIDGLDGLLENFGLAADSNGHTVSVETLLDLARDASPISDSNDARSLWVSQSDELAALAAQIYALERMLAMRSVMPHRPRPQPALRLRPPL